MQVEDNSGAAFSGAAYVKETLDPVFLLPGSTPPTPGKWKQGVLLHGANFVDETAVVQQLTAPPAWAVNGNILEQMYQLWTVNVSGVDHDANTDFLEIIFGQHPTRTGATWPG